MLWEELKKGEHGKLEKNGFNNFYPRKKNFTPHWNFEHNNSRNLPNKNFQENNLKSKWQENAMVTRSKEFENNHSNYVKNNERKE